MNEYSFDIGSFLPVLIWLRRPRKSRRIRRGAHIPPSGRSPECGARLE
ncbi:hypothetical protein DM45_3347 [Burkholderia mallei]|nr:hypothetical protein DM45_3347 [Burkholderia mallei]